MRHLALLLFAVSLGAAQDVTKTTPPQLDALKAATFGTTDPFALKDFVATGTITFFNGENEDSGALTLKALGGNFLRSEAQLASGTRIWVVDGLTGYSQFGDQKPQRFSPSVAANIRNYFFPAAFLLRSKSADITQKQQSSSLTLAPAVKNGSSSDYLLDPETQLISKSSADVLPRPGLAPIPQEFRYSDYRLVNSIKFPFVIEEWSGKERISRIEIQKIEVNTGLTAADFKLETKEQQ